MSSSFSPSVLQSWFPQCIPDTLLLMGQIDVETVMSVMAITCAETCAKKNPQSINFGV